MPESHSHGKLTAGGSPVTVRHREVSVNMLPNDFLLGNFKLEFFLKRLIHNVNLEDFSGNSSSSSSKGPTMSGGSLCCDARKLNISKVAFLIRKKMKEKYN